ncbi:sulfite exporter TauE/SafE family protein [Nakamurella sp. PAMC28650]|uniref:sulfite exporter TauE/SafE family protein n=1 Tax=Nakamurella sp. PAMC28650 TaxID=2762325 RepID=UPI00164D0D55|nr:sulfite exporter TauE/SafE family protein [Nakamurella sp. PAMC28650]QNK82661.1 sulfite exporter TauE/SafE family protein [Nakamurella sp. PAMC28650]
MNLGTGLLLGGAGVLAGAFNAVAGGGSLISFPALLAAGYGSVTANVTNTVALWPGYLGGAVGYRKELAADVRRLTILGAVSVVGSAIGSLLLLTAPAATFTALVPWLILGATAIFAVQPLLAAKVAQRREAGHRDRGAWVYLGVLLSSVYGGYFGAGLGIMLLGVLGTLLPLGLQAINGLKNALSLAINTLAMIAFVIFGPVAWLPVVIMAVASLLGGYVGARIARRLPVRVLRTAVIVFGTVVGLKLLFW